MTENESLKRMKMCIGISPSENIVNSFKIFSDVLEELQQYRAIGTVEEFKALNEKNMAKKQGNINEHESHLRLSKAGFLCCGATNKTVRYPLISLRDLEYCPRCSQKLDWCEEQ